MGYRPRVSFDNQATEGASTTPIWTHKYSVIATAAKLVVIAAPGPAPLFDLLSCPLLLVTMTCLQFAANSIMCVS